MLRPVAQGLKIPAWVAIGIGLSLLGLHFRLKRAKSPGPESKQREPFSVHPGSKDMFSPEIAPAPGKPRFEPDSAAATPPTATPFAAPATRQSQWSRLVFSDIEWRRFEALCERLFAQGGFEARTQSHGADGGVDIWLHSKNSEGPAAVVQCKHWIGKPVGVKELREFFGVMASKGLQRGTFATSSTFTPAAMDFAKENGINVLDGERLLALIGRRTQSQQEDLLAVAYEGEYWKPTCASCGVKMVGRTPAKGGSQFWGCANFPRCRTTMPARGA
jgi:restriction system protein